MTLDITGGCVRSLAWLVRFASNSRVRVITSSIVATIAGISLASSGPLSPLKRRSERPPCAIGGRIHAYVVMRNHFPPGPRTHRT